MRSNLRLIQAPRDGRVSDAEAIPDGRVSEDLLKIQMKVASRITRTLAVITDRLERLRNFLGTNIAAYYDAGLDSICSRMLSRIVQVNHYHASVGYGARKCGYPQFVGAC